MSDSGLTEFYRTVNGRKEIYVSGLFASACASLDPIGYVEITASRWTLDTRYGISGVRYTLSPYGLFRGWKPIEAGRVNGEDAHFLGLALERIERASPEEEPYKTIKARVVDSLTPICRPQPSQTS